MPTMPAPTMTVSLRADATGRGPSELWQRRPGSDRVLDDLLRRRAPLACKRQARHAHPVVGTDGKNLGELDVLDEIGGNVEVKQRPEPSVDGERLVAPALLHELVDGNRLAREGRHEPRHPADRANRKGFERQIVYAGEQVEAVAERIDDVGGAANVVGRFLDGDE